MCHFYMVPRNAHEQKAQRAFASFNCRFHEVSHTLKKIAVFFFVCSLSVSTHGFLCGVCSYEHTVAPSRPQFYIVVCGGSEQC